MTSPTLDNVRLLDSRHAAFLEGKSRKVYRLTIDNQSVLLLGGVTIVWVVISVVIGFFSLQSYLTTTGRQALQTEGVVREGTVTEIEVDRNKEEEENHYYLSYRFFVNEIAYTDKDEVPPWLYGQKDIDSPVYVRYLPDNPTISAIVETPDGVVYRTSHKTWLYGVGACLNLVGVLMILGTIRLIYTTLRDYWFFKRKGRILAGEVKRYEVAKDSNNTPMGQYLTYAVFLEDGREVTGKVLLPKDRFPLSTLPSITSSLAIWYAHEKLHTPL